MLAHMHMRKHMYAPVFPSNHLPPHLSCPSLPLFILLPPIALSLCRFKSARFNLHVRCARHSGGLALMPCQNAFSKNKSSLLLDKLPAFTLLKHFVSPSLLVSLPLLIVTWWDAGRQYKCDGPGYGRRTIFDRSGHPINLPSFPTTS